jgi:hypothetical protein
MDIPTIQRRESVFSASWNAKDRVTITSRVVAAEGKKSGLAALLTSLRL